MNMRVDKLTELKLLLKKLDSTYPCAYTPVVVNGKLIQDGNRRKLEDQYIRLGHIDVFGKSVLDIGCNCGYISFQAIEKGATYCHGFDANKEVIDACNIIKSMTEDLDNQKINFSHATMKEFDSLWWNETCLWPNFDVGILFSILEYGDCYNFMSEYSYWAKVWYIEPMNHSEYGPEYEYKSKSEILEWGKELETFGRVEFLTYTDYQHRGLFRVTI